MQKWPVVKEKHIQQSQESVYCLCLNWTINANSLHKNYPLLKKYVLGCHLSWMGVKVICHTIGFVNDVMLSHN